MSEPDYDIKFEGKKYRKEDFCYYPLNEPKKRMKYCSAFYHLCIKEGKIGKKRKVTREGTVVASWWDFIRYFNEVYKRCKREGKPITWNDFRDYRWS